MTASITHREPLAAEDAARLHMSGAGNPMLITALLALDRPIDHEELEGRLEARLLRYPRFRQRVMEPRLGLGMPRWSDDPSFDVRHQVHRIDPQLIPGSPTLDSIVSDLASMPLGRRHPLWRAHTIDGPRPALVMIIHHALADGASLLALLGELADEHAKGLPPSRGSEHPASLRTRVRQIAAGAAAAGQLALQHADPETALRQPLVGRKHLAFSEAFPLEKLRDAAHVLGTTLTGLLLIAATGACRAELHPSAADEALVLHALVPVDVRGREVGTGSHPDGASTLGNRYGSVLVPLPVGIPDLSTRIRRVRDAIRSLRFHSAGVAAARIATAAGAVSAIVERVGVELFSRKASLVASSVRGPADELHLCGIPIRDVVVWSPASGSIGISVTLMSYAGHVRVAVAVDASVTDDARRLVRELEHEIERVCSTASSKPT